MSVWSIDGAGNATPKAPPPFGQHASRMLALNYCALSDTTISADRADNGDIKITNIAAPDSDLYFANAAHSLSISVNFAADQNVSALCMHHDLSYGAEVRARIYQGATLLADITQSAHLPLYDWGEAPGWDMMDWEGYPRSSDPEAIRRPYTMMWFDTQIADRFIVDISDTQPVMINNLSCGLAWSPDVGHNWGGYVAPSKAAKVVETTSGASYVRPEASKNKINISYDWLSDSDIERMKNILLITRRRGEPLYSSLYPGRGAQREQQGMVMAYPKSWKVPSYFKEGGSFKLEAIETMAYNG